MKKLFVNILCGLIPTKIWRNNVRMAFLPTVFFIHASNTENTGDLVCCPLAYYKWFKRNCKCKEIDICSDKIKTIKPTDFVVIGGGGLIDCQPDWNDNINYILSHCDNVICWALGFNHHYNAPECPEKIDFAKFKLIGIRDYNHPSGLPWLPCVSCKSKLLEKTATIKRNVGVINQYLFPIIKPYESRNNCDPFDEIIKFIAESNKIITSSYHCALWTQYMNKKVILENEFSTKFQFFRHPLTDMAPIDNLSQARKLNDMFFYNVKKYITQTFKGKKYV